MGQRKGELRAVWVFSLVTLVLSVGLLFLLPRYVGPAVIVFIPTILAAILIRLTAGKGQVQYLFSREQWHISLKWLLISLGLALVLRLGISQAGLLLVPGYQFQPGPFSPLLAMVFLFAAGEEIGWRGFALPTLLSHGSRPLTASLILGVPWALLHLPLVLPGMLSEGTPVLAQFLTLLSLSVLMTWIYLASGSSLTTAVLLHGGQNMISILNNGLAAAASGWLMVAIYGAVALLVILFSQGRLGLSKGWQETAVSD
jgi:membrane protease YdiL (CAAX protease family)